jgi:hypothetical protein
MKITKRQLRRTVLETRRRLADNPYAYVGDDVGSGEIPAQYQSKLFSALGMLGFETGLDPEQKDFKYNILDGLIAAERQLKKNGFKDPSIIIDFIKPKVADIFRKEPGAGIPRTEALVAAIPFDVFNDAAGGPFETRAMDKYDPSVMFDEEEDAPPMMDEAKIKITKRQLRRIIKEERTKILKEMNGPGANDPRYRQARAIYEEAQEAVVDMLGFGIEDIQEMAENKSDLSFAAFLDAAYYFK